MNRTLRLWPLAVGMAVVLGPQPLTIMAFPALMWVWSLGPAGPVVLVCMLVSLEFVMLLLRVHPWGQNIVMTLAVEESVAGQLVVR